MIDVDIRFGRTRLSTELAEDETVDELLERIAEFLEGIRADVEAAQEAGE